MTVPKVRPSASSPEDAVFGPAGPDDCAAVRAFLVGLSLDSAYRRFFTGLGNPPAALVRRLVEAEPGGRESVLARLDGAVIALADYAPCRSEPGRVEIGVVVADGWQRCGLGPRLVETVLRRAAARGATSIRAHTLADNGRVNQLLRRTWPEARPVREETVLVWDLAMPPEVRP